MFVVTRKPHFQLSTIASLSQYRLMCCLLRYFQPLVTKELISRFLQCSDDELIQMLKSTVVWRFGKVRKVDMVGSNWNVPESSAVSV